MSYTCKCKCESFRDHIKGITFAPSATAAGREVAALNKKEKAMSADHAAYKRLRSEGMQPKSVKGSSSIEKSDTKFEVENGVKFSSKERQSHDLAKLIASDVGVASV